MNSSYLVWLKMRCQDTPDVMSRYCVSSFSPLWICVLRKVAVMFGEKRICQYLVFLCAAFPVAYAQASDSTLLPVGKIQAGQASPVADSAFLSYGGTWKITDGYATALVIRNSGMQASAATVTLYSKDGKQVGSTQLQLSPRVTRHLDVSSIVPDNAMIAGGGLSLRWNGPTENLSGQVTITTPAGTTVSYPVQGGHRYDTERSLATPWWLADTETDGKVMLFNSSADSIVVSPSLTLGGVVMPQALISLAPYSSQEVSLRSLLEKVGAEAATVGSLTLHYSGALYALQPSLLLFNPHTGFALMPAFNAYHEKQEHQTTTWQYPNVTTALGQETTFSMHDTLTTYALMSNGSTQQSLPITRAYAVDKGLVHQVDVSMAPLEPQETRLINLSQLVQTLPRAATRMALSISHSGQPGDLAITIFTVNSASQAIAVAEGLLLQASGSNISYWDVSSGHLMLHSVTKSGQSGNEGAHATLYYQTESGLHSYTLPATLAVDTEATKVLNFAQIIRAGIPDNSGQTVPQGVDSGLIVLSSAEAQVASPFSVFLPTCFVQCTAQPQLAPVIEDAAVAFISQAATVCVVPPPPPAATCFAALEYRPVYKLGINTSYNHSFWWVKLANAGNYVMDAGPAGSCLPSCGYLIDWVTPGNQGHYPEDKSTDSRAWNSHYETGSLCLKVSSAEYYAATWPKTTYVYKIGRAPNSNTWSHDVDTYAGFGAPAPPRVPGW
jgi:hypothetical protein